MYMADVSQGHEPYLGPAITLAVCPSIGLLDGTNVN